VLLYLNFLKIHEMKIRIRVFVAILLFSLAISSASAQKENACGFKIPPRSVRSNFKSVYEAADILKVMLDSVKWKENFKLKEQNGINNAYATMINNFRWIVYDNDFLENLDTYAATKWASISVLAHEMGHHYYNHVIKNQGSTIPGEIEADKFSGYVMHRLGATLEQSKAAMEKIGSDRASATHPAKQNRLAAIEEGWNMAKAQLGNNTSGGGNSGGNQGGTNPGSGNNTGTNNNTDPNTDPTWIALYMQSPKTETVYLSDDSKSFQAAEIKAGEPFVFKFEIYNYGWLRLKYYNGYRTFKLFHGKDYTILWNRRTKNWTIVEVPD
jgi:hypothetical protein